MKIHIMIDKRRLEASISWISEWLPSVSHMIEIAVFYSFLIGVKEPSIHDRDSEMVGIRFSSIEGSEIFTRHPFIDEDGTCKSDSVYRSNIDSKMIHRLRKYLLTPLYQVWFIWIGNFRILVDLEIFRTISYLLDYESSWWLVLKDLSSMSSSIWWPFVPIITSIEYREGTMCWVKKFEILYEECWNLDPSLRFLCDSHRSPENNSMMHPECPEIFSRRLSISLLDDHTINIPDDPRSTQKFITRAKPMKNETFMFLIVVKKYLRTCSIVAEVFWNVFSIESLHFLWGRPDYQNDKIRYSQCYNSWHTRLIVDGEIPMEWYVLRSFQHTLYREHTNNNSDRSPLYSWGLTSCLVQYRGV